MHIGFFALAVEITERELVEVRNERVLMDIVTMKCGACDFRRAVKSSRWPEGAEL